MEKLLRLPLVLNTVGVSKSKLYEMIGKGEFPKPIKIGQRTSAWPESAIRQWIEQRIAAAK
ncbi:helix-turn-helix transcriptional regulator [Extensimonas vulgaris]|jgi:prophage regulatory protein|uniref:AlpA family transcriptional regulator n=1 Tax=Extensimonas vulgaris TaxID=1031594 RepID=A0A369AUJ6_9BURK|nr:AlpA family transcriptional regulator [Extensimonas vulgaris]RCX11926.1 AlpA family transcriptional regulator [Extensimonas vulgaris]TWI38983.1 AlpA family transcriptional regulator [Extensimonas vulgaris]TXD14923.1 AlpA family transcriptional regulator [Extensimonas vulgaris]